MLPTENLLRRESADSDAGSVYQLSVLAENGGLKASVKVICDSFTMSSSTQPDSLSSTSVPTLGDNPLSLSQGSPPTHPSPVSEEEAKYYYAGLEDFTPTITLVARTGTTPWEMPTGPEPYHKPKEVRFGSSSHPLKEAMIEGLYSKLIALLDSMEVKWTTVDVVRIGFVEEYPTWFDPFPVILWVGVSPGSLSRSDGVIAAFKCREALVERGITDVDVEIAERVVHTWGASNTGMYAPEPETKKKKKGKKKRT